MRGMETEVRGRERELRVREIESREREMEVRDVSAVAVVVGKLVREAARTGEGGGVLREEERREEVEEERADGDEDIGETEECTGCSPSGVVGVCAWGFSMRFFCSSNS